MFEIIPHQTSWKAIEEFLQSADSAVADIARAEQWIHPGRYCHKHGCLGPTELKKQLLIHALEHSDRENSGDAMSAFGDVLD